MSFFFLAHPVYIPPIKPIYDKMILKCLIYLFNNLKYYWNSFSRGHVKKKSKSHLGIVLSER